MVKLCVVCIMIVIFAFTTRMQNEQSDEDRQNNTSVRAMCLLIISAMSMGIAVNFVSDGIEYLTENPPSISIPLEQDSGTVGGFAEGFAENIGEQIENLSNRMKEYSFSLTAVSEHTVGKKPALYYFIALLVLEMLVINIGIGDRFIPFEIVINFLFIIPVTITYFHRSLAEDKARVKMMLRQDVCLTGMFLILPAVMCLSTLNTVRLGGKYALGILALYLLVLLIYCRVLGRFVFVQEYEPMIPIVDKSYPGSKAHYIREGRVLRGVTLLIMWCVVLMIAILWGCRY